MHVCRLGALFKTSLFAIGAYLYLAVSNVPCNCPLGHVAGSISSISKSVFGQPATFSLLQRKKGPPKWAFESREEITRRFSDVMISKMQKLYQTNYPPISSIK